MKRNILSLFVLFFVFVFALTMVAGAADEKAKSKAMDTTIVGKVEKGKIVAEDGKEYKVADNAKGKELMKDHMGHKVEVTGKVSEKNGQATIKISTIKHLSGG
jgi:hypothetical protein